MTIGIRQLSLTSQSQAGGGARHDRPEFAPVPTVIPFSNNRAPNSTEITPAMLSAMSPDEADLSPYELARLQKVRRFRTVPENNPRLTCSNFTAFYAIDSLPRFGRSGQTGRSSPTSGSRRWSRNHPFPPLLPKLRIMTRKKQRREFRKSHVSGNGNRWKASDDQSGSVGSRRPGSKSPKTTK